MEEDNKLAKWLAGEMSEAELEAFKRTPEFNTYQRIADVSATFSAPSFDQDKMYQNIAASRKVKVVSLFHRNWIRIAAAIVLMVGIAAAWNIFTPTSRQAGFSETLAMNLPDESSVVLNAGSEIEYRSWNWDTNRELELNGEAYFKVAKGSRFTVNTDFGEVTVLGTQFNVRARNNRLEVTCYEGRVKVSQNGKEKIITRGENIAFVDGNEIELQQNAENQPHWMNSEISFSRESLPAILSELERQYNVTFDLKDPESQQLFTGVLPLGNLDQALEIVTATYHLKASRNGNKIALEPVNVN